MEKYILDANLFFNMEAGLNLGTKTEEVVKRLTEMARKLKIANRAEFFMPPRVVDEFLSFFENKEQPFLKDFLSAITVKSPDVTRMMFPAQIFYELVADIRQRSYRGLNIGEEEIEKAGKATLDKKTLTTKEFQIAMGPIIKKFRERYRQATRLGFLDSVADLDLIVLTKVLEGNLVSSDEGVIRWGRMFGIKETPVAVLRKQLEALLSFLQGD
ncbi:RNA ligase partner protein [Candidatus Roizmanbacteria bacterium RIFCSPHIGHO2_12_FULL_37_9b]|uniref:RNA ligase partner protein n=1 Tax=Candidatus Roizmanbacteria bacterium RIFCSPHIGHO2_02_FULL_38_11 TaxID=1802039 RepID=A0A1F7GYY0_9BACT|nr:MAG: RNA ligase partner protein [Candidatus Roizmanbacteria bacterium RIFCSPHIGHO2_02_FULL_38_11]OGK35267.1 MAG: RNA ligase partner protein [Candidatus Roizmanbacteria bacterium RIFCSPHIGHO2_12_FULL_37_9b]